MGDVYVGINASSVPGDWLSRAEIRYETVVRAKIHLCWFGRWWTRFDSSLFSRSVYFGCKLPFRHFESQEISTRRQIFLRSILLRNVPRITHPFCPENPIQRGSIRPYSRRLQRPKYPRQPGNRPNHRSPRLGLRLRQTSPITSLVSRV